MEGCEAGFRRGGRETLARPHQGGQGGPGADAERVHVLEADVVVRRVGAKRADQDVARDEGSRGAVVRSDHRGVQAVLNPTPVQEDEEVVERPPRHPDEGELAVQAVGRRKLHDGQELATEATNTDQVLTNSPNRRCN